METDHTIDLLNQARGGDETALAALFTRHRDALRHALLLRLDARLAAHIDVSDILQDTYLEAARRLPSYLASSAMPFHLWLRWLANEQLLMTRRRHVADKRDVGREAVNLPIDSSAQFVNGLMGSEPSPSQAVAAAELAERLRDALSLLDDEEREVILMRHFEQLKNREIALLLNMTEAAANKRYIRALQRLRGMLIVD